MSTIIDEQVEASTDDGIASTSPSYDAAYIKGYVGAISDFLYGSWYRFPGISGLSGAAITVAYIELYYDFRLGTVLSTIYADDQEAPGYPEDGDDYWTRGLTDASVDWDAIGTGTWVQSPSIVSIIQELADSYDPSVIQIIHKGRGTGTNYWSCDMWDGEPNRAPKLYIEYTVRQTKRGQMPIYLPGVAGE